MALYVQRTARRAALLSEKVELQSLGLQGSGGSDWCTHLSNSFVLTLLTQGHVVLSQGPVQLTPRSHPLERSEARSVLFTEQEAFWTLPLHETAVIADIAVTKRAYDFTTGLGTFHSATTRWAELTLHADL